MLVSRGVFETITWSFTDCSLETLIRGNENLLKIKNPISSDLSCLRSSLLPNLFNVIRKNNNKDIEDLAIFEIGPIFYGKEPGEQDDYLCVIKSGRVNKKNWLEKQRSFDFFDIKADLSATLKCFNVNIENCKFSRDTKSYYHPGKSGSLEFGGKEICFFGEINPSIQNNLGLDNKIFTYELNISELFKFYKIKSNSKKKLDASSFQASKRDFSFEINEDIFSSEVISTIKKINKELIKNVSIFDQYEGEKIKSGKKSLSFEVIIQSDTKTLTESEINEISERIISEVKKNLTLNKGNMELKRIRNFSIIAHIDHGKSTLADRIIQICGGLSDREMKEQVLDSMDIERERGITIKAQTVFLKYKSKDNQMYNLNLMDTPGHVDFSYEVSRCLASCEGSLLVVDASQGVEAQTLANVYKAIDSNHEIIPVLNKIDLPAADPERVKKQIEDVIGIDASDALEVSAKTGLGVDNLIERIISILPPPTISEEKILTAMLIDSWYDAYLGVIILVRVKSGSLTKKKV